MENYKEDIKQTRLGSLGGSDGNMLAQIANLGYVPNSARKRLAIMKGLIERQDITTRAMRYGDFIENAIYDNLKEVNQAFDSNPLWVSGKYSKKGARLICHPDFVLYNEKEKTLDIYECKATIHDVKSTKNTYRNQLFIEWTIGKEIVKARGEGWGVRMFLCHYNMEGVDIDAPFEFDPARMTIHKLRMQPNLFDIDKAMTLIDEYVPSLEYFSEDEDVDSKYLPEKVKEEFEKVTSILRAFKEQEPTIDAFKRKLCDFMVANGIKSIKNDYWNITLVPASERVSFDGKKYLASLSEKHPRKAKKIKAQYEKRSAVGAFVKIEIKKKGNND